MGQSEISATCWGVTSLTQYHFCNFPAKDAKPECKNEGMADKPKLRDILQNNCLIIFKSVQILTGKGWKRLKRPP